MNRAGKNTISWLLRGDPAIRWQVMQDLLDSDPHLVKTERARVADLGWGRRLLRHQDAAGMWGGGLYNPKWLSTTYTLLLLRQLGLPRQDPRAQRGAAILVDRGFFDDHGINFWPKRGGSETCVTSLVLSIASYFSLQDGRLPQLADHLLTVQMADGGWNCRKPHGARHSSFNTTILVLEALLHCSHLFPSMAARWQSAAARGREFFLQHRLYQSHRSGRTVDARMTRLIFPPHWHHDILRGLDYFRQSGAVYDSRLDDALAIILKKRDKSGAWTLQAGHPGRMWFEFEKTGVPSRWNTLRALRILRWAGMMEPCQEN